MWLLTLLLLLQAAAGKTQPYVDFSEAGAGFYGAGRELPDPADLKTVRIGVLGPEKTPEGLQQRVAVELAIAEANRTGGYLSPQGRHIPYEMVFHPDDGPWGVAASKVVQFAYEDGVWAIIGALDGQHTHVAELVVAKAWVPVISPGATDSTIDYANVPWVFRAVPDDRRQADLLLRFAESQEYRRIVALTETEREAYTGFRRIIESSRQKRLPLALHLQYSGAGPEEVVPRVKSADADAIVLWGRPGPALTLLKALRSAGVACPVLAPGEMAVPEVAAAAGIDPLTVASPCDLSRDEPGFTRFAEAFRARAGREPSAVALYSYDVARLVIAAIQHAGLNRARIRDEMAASTFEGLTGPMSFSSLGGNKADPVLMSLKGRRWVRVESQVPGAAQTAR